MPELHARLLADVIAIGSPYPLVLTGGYAVRAHRLGNRPSQDLDVATLGAGRVHLSRSRGVARRPGSLDGHSGESAICPAGRLLALIPYAPRDTHAAPPVHRYRGHRHEELREAPDHKADIGRSEP